MVTSLIAGWAADRFGADKFLPVVLVPMGLSMFLIGPAETPAHWMLTLAVLALTQGMVGTLWGAVLPMVYGTNHLGAVRSMVIALMVFSTAIGPGITGALIDWGIPFPDQGIAMGLWCLLLAAAMGLVLRRLTAERRSPPVPIP